MCNSAVSARDAYIDSVEPLSKERVMAMMVSKMPGDAPAHTGAWLYLDEVMHRILNDYTVMLSTVRYAALTVSDAQTGAALNEITHRLNASATAFRTGPTAPGECRPYISAAT